MTTPEDKLAALLRAEAQTVVPAGDGLARIQGRVARRRRTRLLAVPGAALATAAAVTGFLVLGGTGDHDSLQQVPGGHITAPPAQTPTDEPTTQPTGPTGPTEPPVVLPTPASGPGFRGAALWPFTSQGQLDAWQTNYPYADNKKTLVGHYLTDVLGLHGITLTEPCQSCDIESLSLGGTHLGDAALIRYDLGASIVYTIAIIDGTDLTVTSPVAGAEVTSPLPVAGRIAGVDENVNLTLVTQQGKPVATSGAPAGSAVPWTASLSWTDTGWSHAGVVAKTFSAKDGTLNRLTVTPVTRATGASQPDAFVGVQDGHVSLFASTDGHRLRQLTYPPTGTADVEASWNGSSLLWTRGTNCAQTLYRLDSSSPVTVASGVSFRTPQLSSDGRTLAYETTSCADGTSTVVVQRPGSPAQRFSVPSGVGALVDDVADDGQVLVNLNDGHQHLVEHLLRATDTSLAGSPALPAQAGCSLTTATFDSAAVVAAEACTDSTDLVRFPAAPTATGRSVLIPGVPAVQALTAHGGILLVWLDGGDTVGAVQRLSGGRLATVIANGCGSAVQPDHCVRAPDW
jgi:hypothetical protein